MISVMNNDQNNVYQWIPRICHNEHNTLAEFWILCFGGAAKTIFLSLPIPGIHHVCHIKFEIKISLHMLYMSNMSSLKWVGYIQYYVVWITCTCMYFPLLTAFKGGSRTGAPGAPPPRLKKKGTFFGKFSLYIRKYFDFSQHAVFTICILFTTLLTKT